MSPSVRTLSQLIEKSIQLSLKIPDAGNFDSKDVYSLLNRKKELKLIYEQLFKKNSYKELAEMNKFMQQTEGDIQIFFKPNTTKIHFFYKTQWLFIVRLETNDEIYELYYPIHEDQYDLYLIGIFSLANPGSILDWTESCLVVTNKKTDKEKKHLLRFSENRNEMTWYNERAYLVMLENIALKYLAQLNQSRLQQMLSSYPDEMIDESLDLLRIWSLLLVDYKSQSKFEGRDDLFFHSDWEEFFTFYQWAIEHGYYEGATLTRCNCHGDFTPENCIWMSNRNRLAERYYNFNDQYFSDSFLKNLKYEVKGVEKNIAKWEALSGTPIPMIMARKHLKWSDDQIFLPIGYKVNEYTNKLITINDETRSVKEWAEITGISVKTIVSRIRYGWQGSDLISPPRTKENRN